MLATPLAGRRFLDVGSGSGLSSLAAARLGAAEVYSFDYDEESVAASSALRERFAPDASHWTVKRGDILDADYCAGLGRWDVVHSWGVLHHTGAMWEALANACDLVEPGGTLFIAIYNDQGRPSRIWRRVKRLYNRLPASLRPLYVAIVGSSWEVWNFLNSLSVRDPLAYFRTFSEGSGRGMNRWHDVVDWIGGYPFEVATPEEVFDFCHARGFELQRLKTVGGGLACNEYVLRRRAPSDR